MLLILSTERKDLIVLLLEATVCDKGQRLEGHSFVGVFYVTLFFNFLILFKGNRPKCRYGLT